MDDVAMACPQLMNSKNQSKRRWWQATTHPGLLMMKVVSGPFSSWEGGR